MVAKLVSISSENVDKVPSKFQAIDKINRTSNLVKLHHMLITITACPSRQNIHPLSEVNVILRNRYKYQKVVCIY